MKKHKTLILALIFTLTLSSMVLSEMKAKEPFSSSYGKVYMYFYTELDIVVAEYVGDERSIEAFIVVYIEFDELELIINNNSIPLEKLNSSTLYLEYDDESKTFDNFSSLWRSQENLPVHENMELDISVRLLTDHAEYETNLINIIIEPIEPEDTNPNETQDDEKTRIWPFLVFGIPISGLVMFAVYKNPDENITKVTVATTKKSWKKRKKSTKKRKHTSEKKNPISDSIKQIQKVDPNISIIPKIIDTDLLSCMNGLLEFNHDFSGDLKLFRNLDQYPTVKSFIERYWNISAGQNVFASKRKLKQELARLIARGSISIFDNKKRKICSRDESLNIIKKATLDEIRQLSLYLGTKKYKTVKTFLKDFLKNNTLTCEGKSIFECKKLLKQEVSRCVARGAIVIYEGRKMSTGESLDIIRESNLCDILRFELRPLL